ncbi:hypothetical protein [Pyxidicoccus xibeiensis]|uniref:hypothetical protein n=1 Tax=Pyxidicoccus xibeiensis TaxID=2906759 RepID=UPI0020A827FB|nr:hypothetical protein [Pyxidicoccus xibeiensis]MCP3142996.1 hypothetical protein [Pyxidicoccus xibeiensis]
MAQLQTLPADEQHGDCQLPLGYDGVVRIRAAPHLVLRPESQHQPTLLGMTEWQVQVGGSCENVAGYVPCRLEWIVHSDSFDERRMPHRRETCLVPNGRSFLVREKAGEGTRPLQISIYELGLIGNGSLGYRLEPLLFGNDAIEVKPGAPQAIPFELGARIDFRIAPDELTYDWVPDFIERKVRRERVGTLLQLMPDLPSIFKGQLATVELYPRPPEGLKPDANATVRIQWEIGASDAARVQMWRMGFLSVRGEDTEVLENRLAAIGGIESSETLTFQYRLTVSPKPDPEPAAGDKGAKKKAAAQPVERLQVDPRLAREVPRPRLKQFQVFLEKGKLGLRGAFENFSDSVALDLVVKPYVLLPDGKGSRVEQLDDYFRNVLLNFRHNASFRMGQSVDMYTQLCLPDDVATKLSELDTVTVTSQENTFSRELLDLKKLPHRYVEALSAIQGLQVFAAISPALGTGAREVPFWAIADYEASEPGVFSGFAPFEAGAFVSRVFSSGVCSSNTVDLAGHAARLYSPMPVVPPERQEEFALFVGTIVGEAIGQCEAAWKGVAHTIMNRVARTYEKWEDCLTPSEVIVKTGFDGRKHDNSKAALEYMKSPAASSYLYRDKIEQLISAVTAIFMRQAGDCGDVVFFYSPKAQRQLHEQKPSEYPLVPGFVGQKGDKELVDITATVLGNSKDDFRFFAFKHPEKFPRLTSQQMDAARAKRTVAKAK